MAISIERSQGGSPSSDTGKSIVKKATDQIGKKGIDWLLTTDRGHQVIHAVADRLFEHAPNRLFKWEGEEHFEALNFHLKRGVKPVLLLSHKSHADGILGTAISLKVKERANKGEENERITRIVYTMAGSMRQEQGPVIAALFNYGAEPYFNKTGITPDYVVSENDMSNRQMEAPEDNGMLTKQGMLDSETLSVVHAEGKTLSAQINPDTGKPNGLGKVDRRFRGILSGQFRLGIPTVIIPASIEGTERLFSPDKRKLEASAIKEVLEMLIIGDGTRVGNALHKLMSIWFGIPVASEKTGIVRLGKPVLLFDLYPPKTMPNMFGDNLMRLIAQVSSPQYLGDYGRSLLAV